eukprot:m.52092 g.52092  ORF g.52092 m.52092 type:complete len:407 (-) comp6665_c0_seq1:118-1338(-)
MFGSSAFNPTKMKLTLKLAVQRLQMLQKKNENLNAVARKDIAKLLERNKDEMARIKTEAIIREDYLVECMEIIEMFCTLVHTRFGLIEQVKYCDSGLIEAVSTIIWVAPRLSHDVPELKQIKEMFQVRYGKEFVEDCLQNTNNTVNTRVVNKLSVAQPKPELVDGYLVAIADKYGLAWRPPPAPLKDSAFADFPVDLLTGPSQYGKPPGSSGGPPGSGSMGGSSGGGGGGGLGGSTLAYPPSMPPGGGAPPAYSGAAYPPAASYPEKTGPYPPDGAAASFAPGAYSAPPAPMGGSMGPSSSFGPGAASASSLSSAFPEPPSSNPGFAPPPASSSMTSPQSGGGRSELGDLPDLPAFSLPPAPAAAPSGLPPMVPPGGASDIGGASSGSALDFDDLTRRFAALRDSQ